MTQIWVAFTVHYVPPLMLRTRIGECRVIMAGLFLFLAENTAIRLLESRPGDRADDSPLYVELKENLAPLCMWPHQNGIGMGAYTRQLLQGAAV